MKLIALTLGTAGLAALAADGLHTDYTAKRALTTTHEFSIDWEVTDQGLTIDGEEPDFGGGGGGRGFNADRSGDSTRRVVTTDQVVAHEEGAPTKVLRTFGDVEVTGNQTFGENDREIENRSPLSGVKLELALEEGEVTATVKEGEEPPEAGLKGHVLTQQLDGLLPTETVEEGAEYEIPSKTLIASMGWNQQATLFPRPERTEGERPERGEGGGGGGRRGGRGMRGGGGGISLNQLAQLEWETTATYQGEKEVDGAKVVVIDLVIEAEGTLAQPERRGGRRGGDRAMNLSAPSAIFETEASVELKGALHWDASAHRAIRLELEGEFTIESNTSRETQRGQMERWSTTEGDLEIEITTSEETL